MNCLGGNSCTWVLILVIVFLLSQNGTFCCNGNCNNYDNANNGCGCNGYNTGCGCGC